MDPATRLALAADLKRDEGRRALPYQDSRGLWTVGYGHNLQSGAGLSERALEVLLDDDIAEACALLDFHLPWWMNLSPVRQRVLANMAFNLGITLFTFHQTLDALRAGDFEGASREMMRSAWAHQVGARADRLSLMMRTGLPLPGTETTP